MVWMAKSLHHVFCRKRSNKIPGGLCVTVDCSLRPSDKSSSGAEQVHHQGEDPIPIIIIINRNDKNRNSGIISLDEEKMEIFALLLSPKATQKVGQKWPLWKEWRKFIERVRSRVNAIVLQINLNTHHHHHHQSIISPINMPYTSFPSFSRFLQSPCLCCLHDAAQWCPTLFFPTKKPPENIKPVFI